MEEERLPDRSLKRTEGKSAFQRDGPIEANGRFWAVSVMVERTKSSGLLAEMLHQSGISEQDPYSLEGQSEDFKLYTINRASMERQPCRVINQTQWRAEAVGCSVPTRILDA